MGIRTGSGLNPELPPLVVDEGLLNALRGNHRDDPETLRVLKRIKLARTCFKDAYEVHSLPLGCTFDQLNRLHAPHCIPQVAVYSSQWVEECIMAAIAHVRTEHPSKDATLAPGFCISADGGPVLVPRVDGEPDVPVSARVPYAVFFHDRTPELKGASRCPHRSTLGPPHTEYSQFCVQRSSSGRTNRCWTRSPRTGHPLYLSWCSPRPAR